MNIRFFIFPFGEEILDGFDSEGGGEREGGKEGEGGREKS